MASTGSTSWGHLAYRLTEDSIDHLDRWGMLCASGRNCPNPATHETRYSYRTGRAGRRSSATRRACDEHVRKFAARHGIEIAGPRTSDTFNGGIISAAVAAFDQDWSRILVRRDAVGNWYGQETGAGFVVSNAFRTDMTAANTLDEAIAVIEREAAIRRRLVPIEPWQRSGLTATARFARAETTPQWAGKPWTVSVHCIKLGWEEGTWTLDRCLDPQFLSDHTRLGHHNMDLERAIRTAARVLESAGMRLVDGWQLSPDGTSAHGRALREADGPSPVLSPGQGIVGASPPMRS